MNTSATLTATQASCLYITNIISHTGLPSSKSKRLPQTITSLHDKAKDGVSYEELIECAIAAHRSYKISKEETENLEELTRLQARCRLWGIHRAGRVTASNFKAAVCTNAKTPSVSLVKKLCYPEAYRFSSAATVWGCEHESAAVDEFLEWFVVDHTDIQYCKSGLVVNEKFPFLGASPDGVVECSCHGKFLLEVKCPYRCYDKSLSEAAEQSKTFCLKQENEITSLDKNHAYYYQVQCQLNICEEDLSYFVVWAPKQVHIEEIKRDVAFFQECLNRVNDLLINAILPEIIGCWYSMPRVQSVQTHKEGTTFCVCRGTDDGTKMICCDNKDCSNGQWFHVRCLKIARVPKGKWFCPKCAACTISN